MKKIFGLIFLFIVGFTLVACNGKVDEEAILKDIITEAEKMYQTGDSASSVTKDLTLITQSDKLEGVTITWVSDNLEVITNKGVVTRPDFSDVSVGLKITVTKGEYEFSETFNVTVKGMGIVINSYTVNVEGEGLTATPTGEIEENKEVTLTVVVPVGKALKELLVDGVKVELANNKYTFSVTKDVTAKVTYTNIEYKVSLDNEELSVSKAAGILYNEEVTVTVTTPAGKMSPKLLINDVEVTLQDNKYTFSVTKDVTAKVTFEDIKYTATVEGAGLTVSKADDVLYNEEVTLTVVVPAGKTLAKLVVNGVEVELTDSKFVVTVKEDIVAVVTYEDILYGVSAKAETEGLSFSKATGILYNEEVTLTVTVPNGKKDPVVTTGDDVVVLVEDKYTFKVTTDMVFDVTYTNIEYNVVISGSGLTVSKAAGILYEEEVTLSVDIPLGKKDPVLTVDGKVVELTDGSYKVEVMKDLEASVTYTDLLYTVKVTGEGLSTDKASNIKYNEEVTLTIVPAVGKEIEFLSINGKEVDLEGELVYTFNLKEDATVLLRYVGDLIPDYTVTIENITLTVGELLVYKEGTEVTVTVTVPAGKSFKEITLNGVAHKGLLVDGKFTFTIIEDVTIDVVYEDIKFTLTLDGDGLAADKLTGILYEDTVTLTINIPAGKKLPVLMVDGVVVELAEGILVYEFDVTKNITVTVTYTNIEYTVTLEGEGLTASETAGILYGTEVTITIDIPEGKENPVLTINGDTVIVVDGEFMFEVESNIDVVVTYSNIKYTVTLEDDSLTANKVANILYNEEITISVELPTDLDIISFELFINNVEVTLEEDLTYKFNLTENSKIRIDYVYEIAEEYLFDFGETSVTGYDTDSKTFVNGDGVEYTMKSQRVQTNSNDKEPHVEQDRFLIMSLRTDKTESYIEFDLSSYKNISKIEFKVSVWNQAEFSNITSSTEAMFKLQYLNGEEWVTVKDTEGVGNLIPSLVENEYTTLVFNTTQVGTYRIYYDDSLAKASNNTTFAITVDDVKISNKYLNTDLVNVSFDQANEMDIETATVVNGRPIAKPKTPIRDGFKFNGWYLEDELVEFDFGTIITSELNIVAKWVNLYTLDIQSESIISNKSGPFVANTEVTLTFDIPLRKEIDEFIVNGEVILVTGSTYELIILDNTTVSVKFKNIENSDKWFTLDITSGVTTDRKEELLYLGTTVTLTVVEPTGQKLESLFINDVNVFGDILDGKYIFEITEDIIVNVVFIEDENAGELLSIYLNTESIGISGAYANYEKTIDNVLFSSTQLTAKDSNVIQGNKSKSSVITSANISNLDSISFKIGFATGVNAKFYIEVSDDKEFPNGSTYKYGFGNGYSDTTNIVLSNVGLVSDVLTTLNSEVTIDVSTHGASYIRIVWENQATYLSEIVIKHR